MLKFLFPAALAAALLQVGNNGAIAQPLNRSGYDVAWFDEFDGGTLNTALWTAANTNVVTNFSLQDYLPSQVSVSGGKLTILSERQWSRGRAYRSGLITSTALQKYGRWDVRAKLPTSQGMWPAIWLLADAPWPSQGEIDIMENRGTQPNLTSSAFHYGVNDGNPDNYEHNFTYREQTSVHNGSLQDYHNDFHIYSVEWDPDQVRFYVDNVHHWTVRDDDVNGFLTNNVGEMRLIINSAVGGLFLDNPDPNAPFSPRTFEVDYVHAYTKSTGQRKLIFENGGFEENGGSLAQWTKFGDAINNISSGDEHIAGGTEALKLYGQFNDETNYSGIEQGLSVTAGDELTASVKSYVASNDSIAGSDNRAFLKIDYYNQQYGAFGSPNYLSSDSVTIAHGAIANDRWLTSTLTSTVPAGAVEARLAVVFEQQGNAGGAVFVDDVEFAIESVGLLGDFDENGKVDADDVDFYANKLGQPASVDPRLDLDNDNLITLADHDQHINNLLQTDVSVGTFVGDLNLDGRVDVLADAFRLIRNLSTTGATGYAQGDLNADGRIDVLGDAFRLVRNLGQSTGSSSSSTSAAR